MSVPFDICYVPMAKKIFVSPSGFQAMATLVKLPCSTA